MTRITAPQIMYEDADIIVCRKPAGLPTQTSRVGCRDLVSILKNHLAEGNRQKEFPKKESEPHSSGRQSLISPLSIGWTSLWTVSSSSRKQQRPQKI